MNRSPENTPDIATIEDTAALWVMRHDRGLTPAEQDDYLQWLAADTRHAAAMQEHRAAWDDFDRLAGVQTSLHAVPDPDLLAVKPRSWTRRFALAALPLAAAVAVGFFLLQENREPAQQPTDNPARPAISTALAAPIEQRTLEDGSVVSLNRGANIAVEFTPAERRVKLVRGEATFTVAKNPARPFLVSAGGVTVRAVGTEFNVRLVEGKQVEVLVTEGKVQVEQPAASQPVIALTASQGTVVGLSAAAEPAAPQVNDLSGSEMAQRLAWQPRLLDFTAEPLGAIVAEFNRCNPVQLRVSDPGLQDLRLSATFRSDNVEGFARLMESDFGMVAEWRSETEIVLRLK